MPTPTYVPLATVTLGSSASSVTFSSIPATYRDLVIVANGRTSYTSDSDDSISLRFNADTGSNYSQVFALGYSAGTFSTAYTGNRMGVFAFAASASGNTNFGVATANIMDYSATDKHKTVLGRGNNPPDSSVTMSAARWADTAAITSILLTPDRFLQGASSAFVAGCTFNLFGVIA
jgi:hypothetical protein